MSIPLYWEDSYKREFQANIIEIRDNYIILDRTAFYPQGGNQVSDKGIIKKGESSLEVDSVIKEGDKILHHIISGNLKNLEIGDTIKGEIDWRYRYGVMRAHSSQHLLSAIIKNKFDIDTLHANILFEDVMIQLTEEITEKQLKESLEELMRINTIENQTVETKICPKSDLPKYSDNLRGKIPDDDKIRLVAVKGYDLICCGGTHIKNSTEIGPIFIYEFKKGTDIKYVLGQKALELYSQINVDLISCSNLLEIQYVDFFKFIQMLNNKYNALEQHYIKIASSLLEYTAKYPNLRLKDCSVGILEIDLEFKFLQKQFKAFPENYALIILKPENKVIIISNCEKFKANEVLDYLIQQYGGKGGGSPYSAQGTSDINPEEILALIKALYM